MELIFEKEVIKFELLRIDIIHRDMENIFIDNKKTLKYSLEKAVKNKKNRLHKFAEDHLEKYSDYLNLKMGDFLFILKSSNNLDYKRYLNKYGDEKYCIFKVEGLTCDKGIYCFIFKNEIKYIGRSKKTFKERFNEYRKITPYNCLIDGQSTNCHINSRINTLDNISVGLYKMPDKSNEEIEKLESAILRSVNFDWNIQKS